MVNIADINDEESLKAWLLDRPEEEAKRFAVAIASRAALRVLPAVWGWGVENKDSKIPEKAALIALRCNLIACGAHAWMSYGVINEARSSDKLARSFVSSIDAKALRSGIYSAAFAAHTYYKLGAASRAVDAVLYSTQSIAIVDEGMWSNVRADCEALDVSGLPIGHRLWHPKLGALTLVWENIRNAAPSEYNFWLNWYKDMLAGRAPDNWKMLEEIALLPDEDWALGAKHIAEKIAEIQARYAAADLGSSAMSPSQVLGRNARAVLAQLQALKLFVEEEVIRIRAPNDMSDDLRRQVEIRVVALEGIIAAICEMITALADGDAPHENALAVIEEKLPQVIADADALADNEPEVSEVIVAMGATVAYLTTRGMHVTIASVVAVADVVYGPVRRFLGKDKNKDT